MTMPAAPARPWTKRSRSSHQMLGAAAHSADVTAYAASAVSSGPRRAGLPLTGPGTGWPAASPAMQVVIVICAAHAGASRSRVRSGSPGRYMSIDSGRTSRARRARRSGAREGRPPGGKASRARRWPCPTTLSIVRLRGVKRSAGILLYRQGADGPEVLLVHPGGPFWAKKDAGAWSIPKGEYEDGEEPQACALREFEEETGTAPPSEALVELGEVRQKNGKRVTAWAAEGDLDAGGGGSNTVTMQWAPRSGRMQEFPEIDRAGWFGADEARAKLIPAQAALVDRLLERL